MKKENKITCDLVHTIVPFDDIFSIKKVEPKPELKKAQNEKEIYHA